MYTKDTISNKIKKFHEHYGKPPTSRDFNRLTDYPGSTTVIRHFGSWNNALIYAGLSPRIPTYLKFLNSDKILELIQLYYEEYNKIPTTKDFDSNPEYPHSTTINNYFDSWNQAIEKAGFTTYTKKENVYTDSELLKYIKDFYTKEGRVPNNRDFINNPQYPSCTTIVIRFGSWNKAIIAAELSPNVGCYGIQTVGLDKHTYRSAAEAYFCNKYLYNIYEYIIEPTYPKPYDKKKYDWYIPSLDLYIELDGGLRPLVTNYKKVINNDLGRSCLFIDESEIYNKDSLLFFIK